MYHTPTAPQTQTIIIIDQVHPTFTFQGTEFVEKHTEMHPIPELEAMDGHGIFSIHT